MNLPNGWTMPKDVEELLDLLNTHGGTCYQEHAQLIRAFFDKCMGLPPSDGLEWRLVQMPERAEADRESIIEACAKVVDLEAGWCIEEAVKANARGAGVTANLLCGKRDSLVTAAVKIRAMLRGTSPRNIEEKK